MVGRALAVGMVLCSLCASIALAQSKPSERGVDGGAPAAAEKRKGGARVGQLRSRARHIRDLLNDKLEPSVDARALFDPNLDDENAVRIEVERLGRIVARAGRAAAGTKARVDAGAALPPLDEGMWQAQLDVDRARLAFYRLPAPRRAALLASHAERQKQHQSGEAERELSEAERKVGEAERERLRALEAAKNARTEAARIVNEEHARLLEVKQRQAEFEKALLERQAQLAKTREDQLRLRRRVREGIEARLAGGDVALADALYDEVRAALKPARDALSDASRELALETSAPGPGENRLQDLPADIDVSAALAARRDVDATMQELSEREQQFRAARAKELSEQIVALNNDRLDLLEYVSQKKRSAVTGLGPSGLDQAGAELRQVAVILRYHLTATLKWLADMRAPGAARGKSAFTGTVIALKWLMPIALFVWWRRRAIASLERLRDGIREADRKARPRAVTPSISEQLVSFALRVRVPVEWLLLLWAVVWLLPPEAAALLEVQLLNTAFTWILVGSLVVLVVDYFAGRESERRMRRSKLQTAHLRLRSLRLISRVVVGFGLLMALTRQLVGAGTIHGWVWSLCWFAGLLVVLVLVRWWRPVIFELVNRNRKKTGAERWLLNNSEGWTSFVAALVGGVLLLWRGVYRVVRVRVGGLTVTRRVLAYLFSRELDKKADENAKVRYEDLDPKIFAILGADTASESLVPSVADEQIQDVIARINQPGGGVFAVVGERGSGKTRLLRQIEEGAEEARLIRCPFGGMDAFTPVLLKAFQAGAEESLERAAARIDAVQHDSGILVDDAHRLIAPKMGGLKEFDRVMAIARSHSQNACWVFAFDEVIWRLFERLRGAKPLFDDVIHVKPWGEEAVSRLIQERSRAADIQADFTALLPELPADADDVDREEALARTESSYYRLIWDYAGGNPGAALHAWRSSLGVLSDGSVVVKVFQPPRVSELEQLPDSAIFVLRALVQLEQGSEADLCAATSIERSQVGDVLRFGLVRGYVERTKAGEYEVTWTWFRSLTRFLQRRHLLFSD